MIAGIVLAAGASRRLGQPKQLLPLGGRPLLEWTLAAVRAVAPEQIVLVLGHEAAAIQAALDLTGLDVTINERFGEGLSSSLRAGLAAVAPGISAVLVLTGDQPFVTDVHLAALRERAVESGLPIVATEYGDHAGVPLWLDRSVWPRVAAISGDQGARPLLRDHPELVARLPVSDPRMALDVDTLEDYATVCAAIERGPSMARIAPCY